MRAIVGLATAVAVLSAFPLAAQPAGDAARIAEAVQILPEDLRAARAECHRRGSHPEAGEKEGAAILCVRRHT